LASRLAASEKRSVSLHREVGVGRSIADIVAIVAPKKGPDTPEVLPALSVSESVALCRLRRHGPTSLGLLQTVCGISSRELKGALWTVLLTNELLRCGRGDRIALSRLWPQSLRVVAIEAKLTRWRDALAQAVEYRRFADDVYVALTESSAQAAVRHRDEFRKAGVGLMSVNGRVRTLVRPAPSVDHDWRREFVLSRLLTASRAERVQPP
jgi:hypothetical protein